MSYGYHSQVVQSCFGKTVVQRMVAVPVSFSVLLPFSHHYHSVSAAFMLVPQHTLCLLCTNETTSLVRWTEFARL